jgi:uncharacterized protein (DUF983 family)
MATTKFNKPTSFPLAILNHKCPRCRQGNMYKTSVFNISFASMYKNCEHCNLKFEVEPGFFFGAMYFSYALSVAIIGICFMTIFWFLNNPSTTTYVSIICSITLLTTPINFRYSRTLMLHIFGGVDFVKEK